MSFPLFFFLAACVLALGPVTLWVQSHRLKRENRHSARVRLLMTCISPLIFLGAVPFSAYIIRVNALSPAQSTLSGQSLYAVLAILFGTALVFLLIIANEVRRLHQAR
jgi:heme/copper-type cytochrome/quinol oxidase subunit 3